MYPDTFKEANRLLGAGGNPNTGELPICVCENEIIAPGRVFLVSRWKLTPDELDKVKETGEIWVGIMSHSMAPIMPMAFDPFKLHGYKPIDLTDNG